jgi:predicted nucleotidyltransferase component of viral defense system
MSATNALPDKKTFELSGRQLRIHEVFVEKDWYVTQALSVIAKVNRPGFKLVFSGGTALSKAHKITQRFSEDIDFIIVAPEEIQTRKARSDLKHAVLQALRDGGFKIETHQVQARNENRFIAIDLDYETHFPPSDSLRPHIQIEMTVKTTQLPPVDLSVSSFMNELSGKSPEVEKISCLDAVENAADKLSALTWRVLDRRRDDSDDDPALVRHIHDLAMLKEVALSRSEFSKLVSVCMERDDGRAKNNSNFSGSSMAEKFKQLLSMLNSDAEYEREYEQFVSNVSYSEKKMDFKTAVEAIRVLVGKIVNF